MRESGWVVNGPMSQDRFEMNNSDAFRAGWTGRNWSETGRPVYKRATGGLMTQTRLDTSGLLFQGRSMNESRSVLHSGPVTHHNQSSRLETNCADSGHHTKNRHDPCYTPRWTRSSGVERKEPRLLGLKPLPGFRWMSDRDL